MLFEVTSEDFEAFKRSNIIGMLYTNKSTYDLKLDYYGKGRHCLEVEDGIDADLECVIAEFFLDQAPHPC